MLKNSLKVSLALTTALAGVSGAAIAEEAMFDGVEEVVVTASRREQPITEVAKSIDVIGEDDLRIKQYSFVLDALQSVPGVTINQNGSFGGVATVSIRGASSDQTVVLIDGVQVNDPSATGGGYNFAGLDPNGIERIEVLRGPQAVLYGSDAMGGVINIITKSGGDALGDSAFAEYGSYNSLRTGANISGGTERISFNLAGTYVDTDGISSAARENGNTERDGFESLTLRGKMGIKLSEAARLELNANYIDSDKEIDGFALQGDGSYALGDTNEVSKSEEYALAARGFLDLFDGMLSNTVSIEYSEIDRKSFIGDAETYGANGERLNLDYLGTLTVSEDVSLTAGLQHEEVKAASQDPEAISTDSIFGSVTYTGIEGLTLTGGVRHDDHETFGGNTSFEAAAAYLVEETGTRIHATWGEGFKAPTIFQLTYFCCGFDPNPNLKPEQTEAWEVGVEQSVADDRITLGATYFDRKTQDLIIFTFTGGYQNVSRARAKGVELTLAADISETLSFNANYTYTDAKDRDTDSLLARRPKHQAYAALVWAPTEKLSGAVSVTHNGRELDSGTTFVDDWTRVDLRAAYKLNDTIELYGRVENLFDADYQQVLGYGTPGASAFGGIRARF
ncbi:TonB-dependent receptor plug domain-containing protein [Kordiimonas gwangyangensis]|uniref:TonB-dependent receptor plug domain-containing protein n=1 Tax=Kordiimonas gwangyangensis TaxID=288022 RepID=UPI00036D0012|nr:TonB-dependent receptor [Kordiimonas gwangyangensis]